MTVGEADLKVSEFDLFFFWGGGRFSVSLNNFKIKKENIIIEVESSRLPEELGGTTQS